MTLRAEIQIVPYGHEENKYPIFRVDISNQGVVEDRGFGHIICHYDVKVKKYNNETQQRLLKAEEWEKIYTTTKDAIQHDRRDGALALVQKAINLAKEKI